MVTTSFDPGAAARPDSGIFGLPTSLGDASVVLLPVSFEATCSYGGGTRMGPSAILHASKQVELFDVETGHPYQAGIVLLPEDPKVLDWDAQARRHARAVIDAGGVVSAELEAEANVVNDHCASLHRHVEAAVLTHLRGAKIVGVVGGEHSVSLGTLAAHAQHFPGMGILHVDAHADLRLAYEGFTFSHASIMRNVMDRLPGVSRLVQVGIRDLCEEEYTYARESGGRIHMHTEAHVTSLLHEGQAWQRLCERMIEPLPRDVYVSFDIDGLDPSLCPHTGTPVPGGLSFAQAMTLLRVLGRSGRRLVGFDLTEVAPGPEGDEWDANVGARVLYKLIGWALKSRGTHPHAGS